MSHYDKPHLTYEQQIELLVSRGLHVNNIENAINLLRNVGYYKFNAYTKPFLKPNFENKFISGVSFLDIENLMTIDMNLRTVFNSELQKFELSLKSNLAYITGITDKFIHYDPQFLSPNRNSTEYEIWLEKFQQDIFYARNMDLAKHMSQKYQNKYPIWIAVEIMSFGTLTKFYALLTDNHKNEINTVYKINNRSLFKSMINNFREIRNICAHNMRLWNHKTKFIIPKVSLEVGFDQDVIHINKVMKNSVYRSLVLLISINERIDGNKKARIEFKKLINRFEFGSKFNLLNQFGVPENWKSLDFWGP